jgi:hypothetical protein
MTDFLVQHFDTIVASVKRVVREPESYIEIKFSVLTLRVYPARAVSDEFGSDSHWRLKYLASFMLALADELVDEPTRFAFEYQNGTLAIGIIKSEATEIWMPCEIVSLDKTRTNEPASARFSFHDEKGQPIALSAFRRIRL